MNVISGVGILATGYASDADNGTAGDTTNGDNAGGAVYGIGGGCATGDGYDTCGG